MKVPVISSLALLLGCASPLIAIERPKSLDEKPQENRNELVKEEQLPGAEAEAVAFPWLGVLGKASTETLRAHLALEGGVVLRYVADGSPAAAAGLQAHDIILDLGDRKVASQEDLREAVAQHKPGDKVPLIVISKGQRVEKDVVIGERPAGLARPVPEQHFDQLDLDDLPDLRDLRGLDHVLPGGLPEGDGQAQLEAWLKELDEKLRDFEDLPGMDLDIEEMLKNVPRGEGGLNMGLKTASQITLMDEQGSVEMKFRDGGKEVAVRDLEGGIIHEGPWDNEQDRAAVPAEVRERIEKLNFDIDPEGGGGLRLQFGDLEPEAEVLPEPERTPEAAPEAE